MDASVRTLRRRRRRYALSARGRRVLRAARFPAMISLPRGRNLMRRRYLFWRLRLLLLAGLAAAGWFVLGLGGVALGIVGVVLGLAAAIAAELVFSYRPPYRVGPLPAPGPSRGPGGPAGVREPRRPSPAGGAGAAQLAVDPSSQLAVEARDARPG